jgi:hypothetical protein
LSDIFVLYALYSHTILILYTLYSILYTHTLYTILYSQYEIGFVPPPPPGPRPEEAEEEKRPSEMVGEVMRVK